MDLQQLRSRVQQELSPTRFDHVEGVVQSARQLAQHYRIDAEKAQYAAWIHDIAREWTSLKLQQMAKSFHIESSFLEVPDVLHGPIASFLARDWFGVTDEDVRNAIYYHTTGRPKMSPLEQVVFVADAIEPGREYPGVDALRVLAHTNLELAVGTAMDSSIRYLLLKHRVIFPLTILARNYIWDSLSGHDDLSMIRNELGGN